MLTFLWLTFYQQIADSAVDLFTCHPSLWKVYFIFHLWRSHKHALGVYFFCTLIYVVNSALTSRSNGFGRALNTFSANMDENFCIPSLFTLEMNTCGWILFRQVSDLMATRGLIQPVYPGCEQVASWLQRRGESLFKQQLDGSVTLELLTQRVSELYYSAVAIFSFSPYSPAAIKVKCCPFESLSFAISKCTPLRATTWAQRSFSSILKRLVRWLLKIWGTRIWILRKNVQKCQQKKRVYAISWHTYARKCQDIILGVRIAFCFSSCVEPIIFCYIWSIA
jgi:hypothetical protein